MENYREINAKTVDRWVEEGWEWGIPITSEEYKSACQGKWDLLLTPTRFVPHEWFLPYIKNERLDNVDILGLASGGGQQMPVFAALGAYEDFNSTADEITDGIPAFWATKAIKYTERK